MGTNYSYRLMINTKNEDVIKSVSAIAKTYNAEGVICRFLDCGKWDISKMVSDITTKHPDVMVRVDTVFDNRCYYTEFYLGKKKVDSHWVQDYFPSVSRFKSGIKRCADYIARKNKQREEEEALAKATKEKEAKDKEIKLLKELKEKYPEVNV